MCEPISAGTALAISAGIAAAGTATTLYVQSEQADAQQKYQNSLVKARDKEVEETYALAVGSMHNQTEQMQRRLSQEGERASMDEQENAREAARARATVRTAAGEAGVGGASVDALLDDFVNQEAMYRDASRRNLGFLTEQTEAEMEGVRAQTSGRIQSVRPYMPEPVARPSLWGAGLRIAGDAADAYRKHKQTTPDVPKIPKRGTSPGRGLTIG